MPTLQIENTAQLGSATLWLELLGILAYPQDKKKRERLLCIGLIQAALEEGFEDEIPSSFWAEVIDYPPAMQVWEEMAEQFERGRKAGDVLDALHRLCFERYPEPSLRKALFLIEQDYAETTRIDGGRMVTSDPVVRDCFDSFRSVAHLHAALGVICLTPLRGQSTDQHGTGRAFLMNSIGSTPALLSGMLSLSEYFRIFAESFTSPRDKTRKPILQPGEAWAVPATLHLPLIDTEKLFRHPNGKCPWIASQMERYAVLRRDTKKYHLS